MINNRIIKTWLQSNLQMAVKDQAKKSRYGNSFMIIGSGGYLGWATTCQLSYKFPGSKLFLVDKNFTYEQGVEDLRRLFNCNITVIGQDFSNYFVKTMKPDIVINLANKKLDIEVKKDTHLIILDDCKNEYKNPVTVLETPTVIGNWNMVTLRCDSFKIKTKSIIDDIIYDVMYGEIKDRVLSVVTLEDFTRTIVKVCRKTKPINYDKYQLFDRYITVFNISKIVAEVLKTHNYIVKLFCKERVESNLKRPNKEKYIKLIDKHRPLLESVISYSCREVLNERYVEGL